MARRKEKQENSALKTIVILLAILVIVFPAAAFGYVYFKLSSIHLNCAGDLRELLRVPLRSQGYCGAGTRLSGLHWVAKSF